MKKYHRFHHDAERRPLLFFVAVFVLGTVALGGTFLFFARLEKPLTPTLSPKGRGSIPSSAPSPEEPTIVIVNAAEYRVAVTGAFTTFRDAVMAAASGWVDAPGWDSIIQSTPVAQAIERATETLRATLIETRVPGPARQVHLLMVVAAEDLLDAVRSDRVEAVEGLLLRLQELINVLSSS
ncbi:MAG: hypothetical protein AAB579_03665 [Patescibacteria group bacterium]